MNQPPLPPQGIPPEQPQGGQPYPPQQGVPPQPQQAYQQGGQPYAPQQQPPYPVPPGGYPGQPQAGVYLPKTGPSKALGVVKMIIGGGLGLIMIGALVAEGYNGSGVSAGIGIVGGLGVWLGVSGLLNLAGKKMGMKAGPASLVATIILFAFAGPPASSAHHASNEEKVWNDLTSRSADQLWGYMWEYDYFYDIPEEFHRVEAKGEHKHAEIQQAIRDNNLVEVRRYISEINTDHAGDKSYDKALKAASAALKAKYDEVLAKLAAPAKTGGLNKITADEDLRDAFKIILADLASAGTPNIYLAFSNSSKLAAPEGHEEMFESMKTEPSVKLAFPDGKVPVIDPETAFSEVYDSARQGSFMKSSKDAFSSVFQAHLLDLKALENNENRKGKIVMEVSSEIQRTKGYFNYYNTSPAGVRTSNGLLFGIQVLWSFKLYDREGKLLYEKQKLSSPGQDLSTIPQAGDPKWAVYSILMDSAYYNYSRELIGSFGLTTPLKKTSFAYSQYGG
ncbi:MAG: hypothetical protein V3V10_05715 [Planctomycetota bacterium]